MLSDAEGCIWRYAAAAPVAWKVTGSEVRGWFFFSHCSDSANGTPDTSSVTGDAGRSRTGHPERRADIIECPGGRTLRPGGRTLRPVGRNAAWRPVQPRCIASRCEAVWSSGRVAAVSE